MSIKRQIVKQKNKNRLQFAIFFNRYKIPCYIVLRENDTKIATFMLWISAVLSIVLQKNEN